MITLENVFDNFGMQLAPNFRRGNITTATILVSADALRNTWETPEFQRALKINKYAKAVVKDIATSGVIPGVILLGLVDGHLFLYDGQHRIWAALQTEYSEFVSTVIVRKFEDMAAMGIAAMQANLHISIRKPDDNLKTMEGTYPVLRRLREQCPFIGYAGRSGNIVLSIATAVHCWITSKSDCPSSSGGNVRGTIAAMTLEEADELGHFLKILYDAWGTDRQYSSIWSRLNVTIVMWLWREAVLGTPASRVTRLSETQFAAGIAALTADEKYMNWLPGRLLREHDRGPCYNRIKKTVTERIRSISEERITLPSPNFATKQTIA